MAAQAPELTEEQAEAVAELGRLTGQWGRQLVAVMEADVDVSTAFDLIGIPLPPFAGILLERKLRGFVAEQDDDGALEDDALEQAALPPA